MDAGWLDVAGLTPPVAEAFLAARRAEGYVLWLSPKALVPPLGYLRRLGAAPLPEPAPVTPAEALLRRYQHYLVQSLSPCRQSPWAARAEHRQPRTQPWREFAYTLHALQEKW
jgi:hypothetical protein